MSFISVPCKKTTEVDLVFPMQRWITSKYPSADRAQDKKAIAEFQKLRNDAVCRVLDRTEYSIELLYRYCEQLVTIESKLPFTTTEINVTFNWMDAFGRGSLALASEGLERACVLFNIAAMQSQVAAAQTNSNDSELKLCAKLFQQSAGTLNFVKDCVMSLVGKAPTTDLMPETLAALAALMIAQGQEAIYIKTSRDQMKPAIVAKIAAQTADFYVEAHKQMNVESLRSVWPRDWLPAMIAKQVAFQALANYYQSMVIKEEKQYGVELGYLTTAKELMGSNAAAAKVLTADDAVGRIRKAYDAAKKDNDFIYHDLVPDAKKLPPIAKAALAKPLAMEAPRSGDSKDLFAHLVPEAMKKRTLFEKIRAGVEAFSGE